jgi:polyisoprenoid-binding protein YceI
MVKQMQEIDYTGKSNELSGRVNFETGEVNFKLRLKSLDTGIDRRNKHMFKALNAESHPYAEFKGRIISDFDIKTKKAQ